MVPPNVNPTQIVLDVTSVKATEQPESSSEDTAPNASWSEKWRSSQEKEEVVRQLGDINSSPGIMSIDEQRSEYTTSWFRQLTIVSNRLFRDYWRSPTYVYSKIELCTGVVSCSGLLPYLMFLGSLFSGTLQWTLFSEHQLRHTRGPKYHFLHVPPNADVGTLDQQVIPRIIDGRDLFEAREQRSKSYSRTIFLTSNIIVEVLWQTLATILVFVTFYYPMGLWRNGNPTFSTKNRGALSFVSIWLFCLWIITFSQAVGVGIQHAESAIQLAILLFWLSLVFCG